MVKTLGLIMIVVTMTIACNQKSVNEQEDKSSTEEQAAQPEGQIEQAEPAGGADAYGRLPGDEHYGHDHPPQDQQEQQEMQPLDIQTGGADDFGRNPGDEHYGHDHP